jgi:hypothetical protein
MANIPMAVEVGASNGVENYSYNKEKNRIDVLFEYIAKGFIFYDHYLCLIGRVYMFYVGHVDRVVYMKPFSTVILQVNIIIIIIIKRFKQF